MTELTYPGYLRLPEILQAQSPLAEPPARDEMAFIIVHQACELWFKLMLTDLELIRDALLDSRPETTGPLFRRLHAVGRVLNEQLSVLEIMGPDDFAAFRDAITPASGLQSAQYRELEFLSGLKTPSWLDRLPALDPDERSALHRRLAEPTVWDGYLGLLGAGGLPTTEHELPHSLRLLASGQGPALLAELAAHLHAYDETAIAWRRRHVVLAHRLIGDSAGTGGTSGVSFLHTTAQRRFYPHLAPHFSLRRAALPTVRDAARKCRPSP